MLVDILEPEVDEKYFVKDSRLKWLQSFGEVGSHNGKLTFDPQASHCVAGYITGKSWGSDGEVLRSSNIRQGNRVHLIGGKSPTLSSQGGNLAGGSVLIVQWPHGGNKGGLRAIDGKTPALTTSSWPANNLLLNEGLVRKLTPVECERLQTVPDGYTSCVSDTQRYKMLGNGWTVDVIAHIFKGLKD
jgi:site-specific DNA-cytosine methylase